MKQKAGNSKIHLGFRLICVKMVNFGLLDYSKNVPLENTINYFVRKTYRARGWAATAYPVNENEIFT